MKGNSEFCRLLRQRRDETGRRMSVSRLADLAVVGRSHLSQVLNGQRPGRETWPLIFPFITAGEARTLGELAAYETWNRFHGKQITPPHA